ncbi:MAG: DnaJ domain-containing protein [Ornithinimicrobium sp.]
MHNEPTYYEILQIREDASPAIIKAAYRELMRSVHPDVNGHAPTPAAVVNEARDVLSDPERRRQYDAELWAARSHRQHESSPQGPDSQGAGEGAGVNDPQAWGQEVPWTSEEPPTRSGWSDPPGAGQWGYVADYEIQPDHTTPGQDDHADESYDVDRDPDDGSAYHFGTPRSWRGRTAASRMPWLRQWPIAVWSALWVGAQAVADALAERPWTGLLSAAILVIAGWWAARTRSRGGPITTRYVLWLVVGVALTAVTYATSLPSAVLFVLFYVSWIVATEYAHRLRRG